MSRWGRSKNKTDGASRWQVSRPLWSEYAELSCTWHGLGRGCGRYLSHKRMRIPCLGGSAREEKSIRRCRLGGRLRSHQSDHSVDTIIVDEVVREQRLAFFEAFVHVQQRIAMDSSFLLPWSCDIELSNKRKTLQCQYESGPDEVLPRNQGYFTTY